MFQIGNIKINSKVVLAPMAGISNPAYIKLCEEMGLGYAITELISSEAIIRNSKKTFDMLNGINDLNIPVAVQLFGSNPSVMASAAKILVEKYNIKIIDINMGCPVPKVALRSSAGSALLKDPDKVYEMVKKVVDSVDIPVTVKIRSGWDNSSINAIEIAKKIEVAGAKAISIHARTRSQGYSGSADWNIIKEVKKIVKIPVIGNGDIKTCYDAKKMLDLTKCDAVMIGRALLGNPWLIKECNDYLNENKEPTNIDTKEKIDMILKHIAYLRKYKDDKIVNLEMRTNIAYYLKGIKSANILKEKINKCKNVDELISLLKEYKELNL